MEGLEYPTPTGGTPANDGEPATKKLKQDPEQDAARCC